MDFIVGTALGFLSAVFLFAVGVHLLLADSHISFPIP